jgi:hypothetical protein
MSKRFLKFGLAVLAAAACASDLMLMAAPTLPPGFTDSVVLGGLTLPTVMEFSPDGRIFVGEKSGRIKVFDSVLRRHRQRDGSPLKYTCLHAGLVSQGSGVPAPDARGRPVGSHVGRPGVAPDG